MILERPGPPLAPPRQEPTGEAPTINQQQVDHDTAQRFATATHNRRMLHHLSIVVLVVGLAVTGVLTVTSRLSYLHNEQRLSNLQTKLTASALGVAPVELERRLGEAARAAGGASEPAGTVRRLLAPSMAPAGPFTTASLALVRRGDVQLLARVGAQPIDSPTGAAASALFERAA